MNQNKLNWAGVAIGLCVALPWLNPSAPGPSPTAFPWLASAFAACLAWWFAGSPTVSRPWLVAIFALALGLLARGPTIAPEMALTLGSLAVLVVGAGVGAAALRDVAWLRCIAVAWLAAALASSALGLLQYFGVAHYLGPLANIAELGEAFGNLRQRNQFATLTSIGVITLLWMIRTTPVRYDAAASLAIALLAVANAASASRTGALQLLLILSAAAYQGGPERMRFIRLGLIAAAAHLAAALWLPGMLMATTGVTGGSIFSRIGPEVTCNSRLVLWSNVIDLVAQKPWTGWGWGELDYAHFIHPYSGARFCDILDNAHSLPLQLAVELGVPFAVLVCAALAWAVVRGRPWREDNPTRQFAWAVLGVIMLHSLLEYPLWYGPFQFAFGVAAGLLLGAPATPMRPMLRTASLAAGLAALAACGYALWDYHRVSQIYLPPQARSSAYQDDPIGLAQHSLLFRNQARFAELTLAVPSRYNATRVYELATELLHYSPEPRVVERLIESAVLLGRDGEARVYMDRYRAAFAEDYRRWSAKMQPAASAPVSD